jgi:hypothetical protein
MEVGQRWQLAARELFGITREALAIRYRARSLLILEEELDIYVNDMAHWQPRPGARPDAPECAHMVASKWCIVWLLLTFGVTKGVWSLRKADPSRS